MQKRCQSISVWLIVVFSLWALPAFAEDNNESATRQLYENALRVYNAENYLKTITLLDKIITDYPESRYSQKSAYLTRLILQYKMSLKELKNLEEKQNKIPGLNPHYVQGIIYYQEGKRNEAFAEFQEILINSAMKRWWPYAKEMVQSYKPDTNILRKDPVKAAKMFESMLEITDSATQETLQIYQSMVRLYEEAKMYDQAISLYKKMIELISADDDKMEYYNRLAHAYKNKGDRENAVAVWNKMLSMKPNESMLSQLAQYYADYDMFGKAEEIYKRLIMMKSGQPYYYQELARVYQKQKKYDEALTEYKKAYELADKSTRQSIDYTLIELYKEAGTTKEIIQKKETELIQVENKLIEAYKKAAQSYEKEKKYKKAAQMYQQALVLSPQDNELKKSLERVEKLIDKTGR